MLARNTVEKKEKREGAEGDDEMHVKHPANALICTWMAAIL